MDKKLTPVRFLPDTVKMPWGTVEYKLADLGFIDSMASEGWLGGNTLSELVQTYLERLVGESAFDWYGTQFPVMVKRLEVRSRTSLHVNPDDEVAEQRYDAFGKTALWYVDECGPDAKIYLGFKRDVTASEFYQACISGNVLPLLHSVKPVPGQSFLITPGIVHAAKDVTLTEIAESSELWFRLHDWGATDREMHLEEAIDLIDFRSWRKSLPQEGVKVPQFAVNRIELTQPLMSEAGFEDSFLIYVCVSGSAMLQVPDQGNYPLKRSDVILVPAEVEKFFLINSSPDTVLLEVRMETRPEPSEE